MTVLDLDLDLANHLAKEDSVLTLVKEQLSPRLIVDGAVKEIFEWQIDHYHQHNSPATQAVLEDQFKIEFDEPQTAIEDLIQRLRERLIRNDGRSGIQEVTRLAVSEPLQVGKKMLELGKELSSLTVPRGESFGPGDHGRAMKDYNTMAQQGVGPSLGWKELDQYFYGQKGVTFLVAAPKSYKSWCAINVLQAQILQGGRPYFYSLELPASDAFWRLKCMNDNIPYWKFLRGQLSNREQADLEDTAKQIDAGANDYRIEKPKQGERTVSHLVERAISNNASCIIIDQLQYLETKKGISLGAANDTGHYFEVCNDLRDYSDAIPIYVVHQFNRTVQGAEGMPDFQQIKGSAAMEEVATLVLGMYSNKDMRQSNLLELGAIISRFYSLASWEVKVELSKGCKFDIVGKV